ncbi:MAG TPA: twin-arginine translocation signal domain-containing protein, partial [Thermoanaerobaculia bacterium]|nr:twin-arginine translocation signal domain-containing protein [Thermoanaerobaculia bacterium]
MPEETPRPETTDASRRDFLKGAAATAGALGFPAILEGAAPYELALLPWPDTALEPVISAKTLSFHWGKHHRGYVEALNGLVKGGPLEGKPLADVVRASAADTASRAVF